MEAGRLTLLAKFYEIASTLRTLKYMKVIQFRRGYGCWVFDKCFEGRRRRAADTLRVRTVSQDQLLKSFEEYSDLRAGARC